MSEAAEEATFYVGNPWWVEVFVRHRKTKALGDPETLSALVYSPKAQKSPEDPEHEDPEEVPFGDWERLGVGDYEARVVPVMEEPGIWRIKMLVSEPFFAVFPDYITVEPLRA